MSLLVIARKEFQDAVRSRALFVVVALFATFSAVLTYFHLEYGATAASGSRAVSTVQSLYNPVSIVLPIVGTSLGYKTIVGERESGSLKLLLGLPHTRQDVVLGKLVGRSSIVALTVLVGSGVAGSILVARTGTIPVTEFARFTGILFVLGIVFLTIAVAFSTAVRSPTVATWGSVGLTILFAFLWDGLLLFLRPFVVSDLERASPDWFVLLRRFNPRNAFDTVAGGTTSPVPSPLEPWFWFVLIGVWLVIPIGLAMVRFERGDLG